LGHGSFDEDDMELLNILLQILNFFRQVLPFIFIGFVIANLIKISPYFSIIGLPMSYTAQVAYLPRKCSAVLTLYLLNSYSALGMLSENIKEKTLEEKQVFITVIISYFPKGIQNIVFFLAPVALSVFGIVIGGGILVVEFMICLGITTAGIIGGRILLDPTHDKEKNCIPVSLAVPRRKISTWKSILRKCLEDSVRDFYEIAILLIPTGAIIIFLFNIGAQEYLTSFLSPFLAIFNLPASSIVVFAAAFVSQVAAISATGTVAVQENLSFIQCLIIYALSRALHLGIGQIKSGLPTNVALFGKSLGIKITALDFSITQMATALVVIILIFVGGL
jgi:hypothetical protein